MPELWQDINDPGFFYKPKPEEPKKSQAALTDNDTKPKEKAGPIASLSEAKFVPPESGLKFNDKCPVQVSVTYKEKTPQTRVTFRLFCDYKDKEGLDLNKKVDSNESNGVAKTELPLYYPDDYSDGTVEYFFTAEHCRGDKITKSETKLKLPVEKKTGWIPLITFSNEYSKVNAYNLALLANLAYDNKENVLNYFKVIKTHTERTFKSQKIIATPFLIDTDETNCFRIQNENEEIFDAKETDTQGFLALNNKQIIISIRGTESVKDGLNDANAHHVPYSFGPGHVHKGFYEAFLSIKDEIGKYVDVNGANKEIIITGHSLGGAVATLVAAYLHSEKSNCKVMLYTFGSPRVGDKAFANHFSEAFPYFRIVNNNDIVPKVPLPYMDLRPQVLLSGGIASLPLALFNPADDPYSHLGKFVHIRRMAENETFLSKLEEQSYSVTLPMAGINAPGALTLEAILRLAGSINDHNMGECYCPILRSNMMKSIKSYLDANTDEVEKLEKDVKSIQNEIADVEKGKVNLKTQSLDPAREQYLTKLSDRMIEGRRKYLSEYQNRLNYYKQTESNKPIYLKELFCTKSNPEIEKELQFQKSLA